jgi:hypothetical protein
MIAPTVIAHADWGTDRRKRQVAMARLVPGSANTGPRYFLTSLAQAPDAQKPDSDLLQELRAAASPGQAMAGFDFPIGLPRAYAKAAGISSFPEFLDALGSPPWEEFGVVARHRGEIALRRPFYPHAPGGARREHLHLALGLTARQLRRRCEGIDAETLFWTLGGKQVGKGALAGWRLLAAARNREPGIALWPFAGPLPGLLDGGGRLVVAETYPREYYKHVRVPGAGVTRWSKRRRADRLTWIPGVLRWATSLGVSWQGGVLRRAEEGFSDGPNGEDEFDAVVGLLAMISVVTGAVPSGEPRDDPAIASTEGWILGRSQESLKLPTVCVLATSLSDDLAASLREDGSATLDEY